MKFWYQAAADAVMLIHFAFIAFALFGALLLLKWPRLIWLHLPAFAAGEPLPRPRRRIHLLRRLHHPLSRPPHIPVRPHPRLAILRPRRPPGRQLADLLVPGEESGENAENGENWTSR
jgi:hypothetical protein